MLKLLHMCSRLFKITFVFTANIYVNSLQRPLREYGEMVFSLAEFCI